MDLLQVKDLSIEFRVPSGAVKAVNGVTFAIKESTTVAIVGESGSGKSTIAQAVLGILPNVATITGGEILFRDQKQKSRENNGFFNGEIMDIAKLRSNSPAIQSIRGSQISMIFQEPMTSLSPLHTIGNQIIEAVKLHSILSKSDAKAAAVEILGVVGFPNPSRSLKTYPFELSGGLRQRAMIAMALVCKPALLIADEPTTALDVTIQAQILKLINDLQMQRKMAVLLIT
ncbi:MAG: ABC transporter ATP-binding protein, partial [Rhodospirillaceae bacterium]|nr:ABC transporter ATP-binding protein [Rhodospirillaceae bacterium]